MARWRDEDGEELLPRSREETIEAGLGLGLPLAWLEALPVIGELPGTYEGDGPEGDAFLVWAAQEHLVRTDRLAEADPMLVAEALEDAAMADGPGWLGKSLKHLMFLMAWPHRNYHLLVDLRMAADHLRGCLRDSPSMWLLLEGRWESCWSSARFKVHMLDDRLDEPPETCPWPTLDDLLHAVDERLVADGRSFR